GDCDVLVMQKPGAAFGLSGYQGDIETNHDGKGRGKFIGRFNIETFIVAPGPTAAPVVHNNAFPDASLNPMTNPIHTYHLGLWFTSSDAALTARAPGNV